MSFDSNLYLTAVKISINYIVNETPSAYQTVLLYPKIGCEIDKIDLN